MLEIKTINKNKKQRSYQVIETSGFGFEAIKKGKEQETKFLLSLRKFPFTEQMSYQGTETYSFCFGIRNKVLIKTWKLVVLVFEALHKAR